MRPLRPMATFPTLVGRSRISSTRYYRGGPEKRLYYGHRDELNLV